ncbi:MAG: hypothetical protein ACJAYR_000317 [Sneathiella sp.]|jgi:hypothetical protein
MLSEIDWNGARADHTQSKENSDARPFFVSPTVDFDGL